MNSWTHHKMNDRLNNKHVLAIYRTCIAKTDWHTLVMPLRKHSGVCKCPVCTGVRLIQSLLNPWRLLSFFLIACWWSPWGGSSAESPPAPLSRCKTAPSPLGCGPGEGGEDLVYWGERRQKVRKGVCACVCVPDREMLKTTNQSLHWDMYLWLKGNVWKRILLKPDWIAPAPCRGDKE